MPVSYTKLPYEQLLCHQAAYDLIDTKGREYFDRWDILEFEKAILGCGSTGYIIRPPQSGQRSLQSLVTSSRKRLACTTTSVLPRKTTESTSKVIW